MERRILSISTVSNPAGPPPGTPEGEILPAELPSVLAGNHISKAIRALHEHGMRSGSPSLRALALNAALERQALISSLKQSPDIMKKEFNHA